MDRLTPTTAGSGDAGLRILLVEDSDTVRVLTAEYLRSRGHTVVDVDCGEDAIEVLDRSPIDVLFTDMKLPGMSGLDLARHVADHHPEILLVMSSGFDRMPDFDAMRLDCRFLSKPYDLTALERALAGIGVTG